MCRRLAMAEFKAATHTQLLQMHRCDLICAYTVPHGLVCGEKQNTKQIMLPRHHRGIMIRLDCTYEFTT